MVDETSVPCEAGCGKYASLWVDLGNFVVGRKSGRAHLCFDCALATLPQTSDGHVETHLNERCAGVPFGRSQKILARDESHGDLYRYDDAEGNVYYAGLAFRGQRLNRLVAKDGRSWASPRYFEAYPEA